MAYRWFKQVTLLFVSMRVRVLKTARTRPVAMAQYSIDLVALEWYIASDRTLLLDTACLNSSCDAARAHYY